MAVPAWFDANTYLNNKAVQMGVDPLTARAAFVDSGYGVTPEGLYQHFVDFGNKENVSPNTLFNSTQYLYGKAEDYFSTSQATTDQLQSMMLALDHAGLSSWDHYVQFGGRTEGLNPSAAFDANAYMADKLAQMQRDYPSEGWTATRLAEVFQNNGFTALTHYYAFGAAEGLTPKAVTGGTPGETFNLTSGEDKFYGTSGDDFFNAPLGTLGDNDYIDGGAGADTLKAIVNSSNQATKPTIYNVEKVIFQAQGVVTNETGSNNISASDDWTVAIDAQDIHGDTKLGTGLRYLQNTDSRADLAIEDLRVDSNLMTIAFSNADPGDVDFGVFFNPQNLKADESKQSGTLEIRLMDVKNAQLTNGVSPLTESPFDKFTFLHTKADGTQEQITLQFREGSQALYMGASATYDTLLQAFQEAITDLVAARPELAGVFSVAKGGAFTGVAGVGTTWTYNQGVLIELTSASGAISAPNGVAGVGWGTAPGLTMPPDGGIAWGASAQNVGDCPLIMTTIHLDNVGRVQWNDQTPECIPSNENYGSEAGDMVVGSMATNPYGGVQSFNVVVDRGSWLSTLSSTNNALRAITATNDDTNGDGINGNLKAQANGVDGQKGQLFIGDSQETGKAMVDWHDAPDLLSSTGLTDVKYFDGSKFEGQLNIGAQLTEAAYAKYLDDVDGLRTVNTGYAPNGAFTYSLGTNNDFLNMTVNGGLAADNDFALNINGGAGNDFINFNFTNITTNQILNVAALDNVRINGDAGNDTVKVWGNGAITVDGGAGNDVIYVGQDGDAGVHNAVFVLNASTAGALDTAVYADPLRGAQALDNDVLSNGTGVYQYTTTDPAGTALTVTVNFRGIASKAITIASHSGTTGAGSLTAVQINKAIIQAINEDPVLKNLFIAKDGAGHSLLVESLIDGAMATGDLGLTFGGFAGGGIVGYNGAYAMGTEALEDGNAVIVDQGSFNTYTTYNISGIANMTAGDYYIIQIGDETYYSAALGGNADGDLITALNAAVDRNGNLLSAKYLVADDATPNAGEIVVTYKNVGYHENVDVKLFELPVAPNANNVVGNNTGTQSINVVRGGADDDVLVLSADSDALYTDTVVLHTGLGNDHLINFNGRGSADAGSDNINVAELMNTGAAAITHTIGDLNAALVEGHTAAADSNIFTVDEFLAVHAVGTALTANAKNVVLFQDAGSNVYTVFYINNNNNTTLDAGEVTLLGSITLENGAAIVDADFTLLS